MSNADRIARARAEAEATEKEKAAQRKARAAAPPRTRKKAKQASAPASSGRVKLVWAVGKYGQDPVRTFPYAQKAEAQAEAARLGHSHIVTPLKIPMD